MKYAIIALTLMVSLSACDPVRSRAFPDVVNYSRETMDKAANEMAGRSCPILTDTMMPDYGVMRDQTRRLINGK